MDHSRPHGSADERRRDAAPTAVMLDACVTVRPVAQARPDEPSPTEEAMPRSERLSPEVIRAWAT
jgi:hypothetical protein